MRRTSILGLLGVVTGLQAAGALGCSSASSAASAGGGDGGADARTSDSGDHADSASDGRSTTGFDAGYRIPPAWNATYVRPTPTAAASGQTACSFTRGMMPAQTLAAVTALDSDIPIDHVVVLMQENRSFDTYMGHLQKYEATKGIVNTIESAPDTASNPNFPVDQVDGGITGDAGSPNPYQHASQLCFFDTAHSWGAAHEEYDHGLNDGFYFMNNGNGDTGEPTTGIAPAQLSGDRSLWWYDERDLPFHYSLYSTFAMADHYHSALLGPTWPNRMYLYSATSFGRTDNTFPDITAYPTVETPVILFDELAVRGVSFNWYTEGSPAPDIVLSITAQSRYGVQPEASVTQFLAQAKAGTLPAVSFIDGDNANETSTGDDEHPPSEIEIGQHFVWSIVNAVTTSPLWSHTALFITYDENGGTYDHVVPPPACPPDSVAPVLNSALDKSQPGSFNQYGFRVPFVVVSPYAKPAYVSHQLYSHTSITRFIEAKWKLPALTARDANADPFTDLFDWTNPTFLTPPTFAEPTVNANAVSECTTELTATSQ